MDASRDGGRGRLDDLLDREALRDLVQLYGLAVDDHDMVALESMFAPEATFDRDGDVASGWPAIAATLGASMDGFQMMVHTPEVHVVELLAPDRAGGVASGHAELVTRRGVIVAGYRYTDRYRRRANRWVFESRAVRFLYAAPVEQYSTVLASEHPVQFPGSSPQRGAGVR